MILKVTNNQKALLSQQLNYLACESETIKVTQNYTNN